MGLINQIINVFKLVYAEGEKAWLNEDGYKEALNELYESLENNEITEEEYEIAEAEILEHLYAIREYKKEHDMEGD